MTKEKMEQLKANLHSEMDKIIQIGAENLIEEDVKPFKSFLFENRAAVKEILLDDQSFADKSRRVQGILLASIALWATGHKPNRGEGIN